MTVYALIELEITNMNGMGPYLAAVSGTIANHGGTILLRPGSVEVVEGEVGGYPVKVIVEFPSMDKAKTWYASPEYQAILPLRLINSKGNFVWAEGM